jgi:hypothetical protein
MLSDSCDLQPVLLDMPVTGDDQPAAGGYLRDLLGVLDSRRSDWAGRPRPFVDQRTRITRRGDIVAQTGKHPSEAEQIRVDAEPDVGWLDPPHATRWEFSHAC